jgi:hypothetical protein
MHDTNKVPASNNTPLPRAWWQSPAARRVVEFSAAGVFLALLVLTRNGGLGFGCANTMGVMLNIGYIGLLLALGLAMRYNQLVAPGRSYQLGGHPETAHRTARSPSRAAGAADA